MATHLRIYSDIHLDFDMGRELYSSPTIVWAPTELPEDNSSILVLAGDLWTNNLAFKVTAAGSSWIEHIAKRFEHVIVVLGNHDYWGLSLQSAPRKAKEAAHLLSNVSILEQDAVTVSGIKFVGGTLWTNYGRDPFAMELARSAMVDYSKITFGDSRVRRKSRPQDMFDVHRQTAKFIFNNCTADVPDQPVVIVTHIWRLLSGRLIPTMQTPSILTWRTILTSKNQYARTVEMLSCGCMAICILRSIICCITLECYQTLAGMRRMKARNII